MSGEELIEEKCVRCQYFDAYDGCTKDGLVYYNSEEECIECEDYKEDDWYGY